MIGDYPFENLGADRFQQLCQALLVREHPYIQCFPVGQPDGGRDASSFSGLRKHRTIVYQVKFAKNGLEQPAPRDWLFNAIKNEMPKVRRLISDGATEYVILTNVPGTAHLEGGSIDRLTALLEKGLTIPARCYWRDDLSRRLDNAWDLKWVFPEIMVGQDLIRAVIEASALEDKTRRSNAIRAFVSAQYFADRQIRFKQIDLENPLLGLFIDVPIVGKATGNEDQNRRFGEDLALAIAAALHPDSSSLSKSLSIKWEVPEAPAALLEPQSLNERDRNNDQRQYEQGADEDDLNVEFPEIGAAALLVSHGASQHLPRVVLEGAPGQGKSTVTQYICQLHRIKLLKRTADEDKLDPSHNVRAVRLPIRADLRDFAAWLKGRDPFAAVGVDRAPDQWMPTLEAFLAALIHHNSGGAQFDVSDLIEVSRVSAVLLVLDGLDEVADASLRLQAIAEIEVGVARLADNAASLQTIVTSRPPAFAASPGLSEHVFPRLVLGAVTRPIIAAYANQWLQARRVSSHEADEFRRTLTSKLDLPHISELARNPMQLAILLTLINTRGVSLPEKRTALYGSYMDLFISREAEKSDTVRTHRDLLLSLHGFIAWVLHSEAETNEGDQRGRISQERLLRLVAEYLDNDGRDPALASKLFAGVVERVVALTSRLEGSFEFDVQPLREYFAARYLYETSQHSRAGSEKKGTKPDRFDMIARSPYWLNVTRFFAGFCDKGELAMLVERITELSEDPDFRYTSHPQALATTLLGDWVFAQTPKTTARVAAQVIEPARLRLLVASQARYGVTGDEILLADECGREIVADGALSQLAISGEFAYCEAVAALARTNSSEAERVSKWETRASSLDCARDPRGVYHWLVAARQLEIVHAISCDAIVKMLRGREPIPGVAPVLVRAGRSDVLSALPAYGDAALRSALSGKYFGIQRQPSLSVGTFSRLADLLCAQRGTIRERGRRLREASQAESQPTPGLSKERESQVINSINGLRMLIPEQGRVPHPDWHVWESVVEESRTRWGEQVLNIELALAATEIGRTKGRRSSRTGNAAGLCDNIGLLDDSRSLVQRLLVARTNCESIVWWGEQLSAVQTGYDATLTCVALMAWGSEQIIEAHISLLTKILTAVSSAGLNEIVMMLRRGRIRRNEEGARKLVVPNDPLQLSDAALCVLWPRLEDACRTELYERRLIGYDGQLWDMWAIVQSEAARALVADQGRWKTHLDQIANAYSKTSNDEIGTSFFWQREQALSPEVVSEVTSRAEAFPFSLVGVAESLMRQKAMFRREAIAITAQREGWFVI
ncbi:MAG: hypothetical protein ABI625_02635 [bacterium]